MLDSVASFFNSDDFMPHGHCFLWQPNILWLHVLSDAAIVIAYYSIPFALIYLLLKRKDLPFGILFCLFAAFILLCGTTHLLSIWVLWHPDYALEGILKAATAIVSISTFFAVLKLIPQALALKSPAQLTHLNTELELALKEARQSKFVLDHISQFEHLANSLPQLVWMADATGSIYWYNRRWYEYTGTTPEEMTGWGWKSVHDEEKLPAVLEKWRACIASGDVFEMVFPLKSGDGSFRSFLTRVTPIRDEAGHVIKWIGTNTDITAQTIAEKNAIEEKEQLIALIEESTDYIGMADLNGNLRYHNRSALNMIGLPNNYDISNRKMSDMHPAWAAKLIMEIAIPATYAKGSWQGETALLHNDGTEIPVDQNLALHRDSDGTPTCFTTIIRNITERKNSEHALKTSNERLQLATSGTSDGLWDWNILTGDVYYSPKFMIDLGYSEHELPYTIDTFNKLLHQDDIASTYSAIEAAHKHIAPYDIDYRLKHKAGRFVWMNSRGQTVWDIDDRPIRMTGFVTNIDERRKAAERLDQYTAALERSNKELDDFAYAASHDLKAPLRVIDNTSKWLEEDLAAHLTDDTRRSMALMRGRVKRMEKLLDDMLEYSRIGRKDYGPATDVVSGQILIENILSLLSPSPSYKITVDEAFAEMQLNRMPLQQVLINLVGNAIKHHNRQSGLVNLMAIDKGLFYEFVVSDDGPGISAEFHDKIFEMFQTLKPRDQVEGSGMGLAMVRKHVELYGGKLWLKSSPGEGSSFIFTWPKQRSCDGETHDMVQ